MNFTGVYIMAETDDNKMLQEFMEEMEKAQENWAKAQAEIENLRFEGMSEDLGIRIVITGKFKVQSIDISPDAAQRLASQPGQLAEDIKTAFNKAMEKAEAYFQEQIGAAMQQLDDGGEKEAAQPPQLAPRLGTARPEMKG